MLEVNKNHIKANLSNLKKPLKTVATSLIVSAVLFIYSGSIIDNVYAYDDTLNIPPTPYEDILERLHGGLGEITKDDLEKRKYLDFRIETNESYDFLKYCTNLESLCINIIEPEDLAKLDTFPKLPKLKELTIITIGEQGVLTSETKEFYKNLNDIEKLTVCGISVGPNTLSNLKNLKTLKLSRTKNFDEDFSKLSIEKLDLSEYDTYDIPLILGKTNIKNNKGEDIEINFGSKERKEEYQKAQNKLDSIIKEIGIKDDMSEKEKIDKIAAYVIETLNYDYSIFEQDTNENASSLEDHYTKGALYGALEENSNAVCGGYAALFKALCKKEGIDCFYISSMTHAWNLVQIEGKLYHLDLTYIDTGNPETEIVEEYDENGEYIGEYSMQKAAIDIGKGKGYEYKWYLETPKQVEKYNSEDHEYIGFPDYMEESANKKVNVIIDNKKLCVSMGGLVGILETLGVARIINQRKREENIKNKKR